MDDVGLGSPAGSSPQLSPPPSVPSSRSSEGAAPADLEGQPVFECQRWISSGSRLVGEEFTPSTVIGAEVPEGCPPNRTNSSSIQASMDVTAARAELRQARNELATALSQRDRALAEVGWLAG
jgi:hypothetical protein|eukprot:COSAG01_NODE_861_length_13035_cov_6.890449_8_plen_123_part_00